MPWSSKLPTHRAILVAGILFVLAAMLLAPSVLAKECEPTQLPDGSSIWGSSEPDLTSDPSCLGDPGAARGLLGATISMSLNLFLIAGAIAAFAMFIFGAFRYMTAKDDPAKTKKARDSMQYAIVGLIIMSMVYVFILLYNGGLLPTRG